MEKKFTLTRVRRDTLEKLRKVAERNLRSIPMQIAWYVENDPEAADIGEQEARQSVAPAQPTAQ
jgi:hypothetical protein